MRDARRPLKKAIFARLDGQLRAIDGTTVVPVGNYVAQESDLPTVEIGEATATDISCHLDEPGQEVVVSLRVWSKYDGDEEADSIMDQILSAFSVWTPSIAGWSIAGWDLDYSDVTVEPTGPVRCGLIRWKAQMYERV